MLSSGQIQRGRIWRVEGNGILYPQMLKFVKVRPVFPGRLRNVSVSSALTGNVLRTEACFSMFGGSHVFQVTEREEKKEVKSGRQKVGAGRKRYCPFVGISVLPSNSVGRNVAMCLSFLIHVWVVEIVYVKALSKYQLSALLFLCLLTATITGPG